MVKLKLIVLSLQVWILSVGVSLAFNLGQPQYISFENETFVSEFIEEPVEFKKKQATLAINSPASSTSSIAIETMTAGMSYLYSGDDSNNSAFYIDLTIDSKNYPVLLDTGSPYLWLYSSNCSSTSCTNNKDNLLVETSSLSISNSTFDLSYTQNTIASGHIAGEELMIIGGFKTNDFQFGLADQVPDIFESYPFVGVLGLPADNSSVTGLVNIISFLYDEGDIGHSKFTICMGQYDSDDTDNKGILFFGDTMDTLKNGEMYTSNILDSANGHWEIEITNVFIDNYQLSFNAMEIDNSYTNTSRIGLLDSGTTSLVLPKDDALKVHSYFPSSITDGENYAIYCNSTSNISLEIAGKNWTMTPSDYLGPAYESSSGLSGYCVSNIQGLDSTNDNSWILGILFMSGKYVEFDYENKWIGFAERNNDIKFVSPSQDSNSDNTVSATQSPTTLISSTLSHSSISSSTVSSHNNASYHNNSNYFWLSSISFLISLFSF